MGKVNSVFEGRKRDLVGSIDRDKQGGFMKHHGYD